MILFAARMIKVVLPLIVLGTGWILFRQKLSRKVMLRTAVLTVLVSFVSNWLVSFLPPLTDEVMLTALGEQQGNAKSSEVFLSGYTIDGKSFTSGKSLNISEGHWFWSGETYAWRPETDPRQPDGVTRTVKLNIPVGWSRMLNFSGGSSRGCVLISVNSNTIIVDTYKENTSVVPIEIGRSETSVLITNQIRYLLLYSLLLFIWSAIVFSAICTVLHSPDRARTWLKCNTGKLIYLGISIITFCLMFCYANKFSLWFDEVAYISFIKDSVIDSFLYCVKLCEVSPPLAAICSSIWYHISPYGEQWLLLISMILTTLSVYITGLIGEEIENIYCGTLATIMMAFSTTVWLNAAYEYRAYPYFLMLSALSLYLYIRKNKPNRHIGWAIAFSVSLACLAMTHYYGMLVCAVYFFSDLFLWRKKQIRWKEVFLFLLPGVCSVSWLLAVAIYQGYFFISYLHWYPTPSLSDIKTLLMFLSGEIDFLYFLLWLFISSCIANYIQDKIENRCDFNWKLFYQRFFFCEIIITVALMYIYGAYLNKKSSSLWADRYFMFLIPITTIVSAKMICDFISLIENHGAIAKKTAVIFVGIIFSLNCIMFISSSTSQSLASFAERNTKKTSEPLREAADWLYQQNDIFDDTTLVIPTYGSYGSYGYWFTDGWIEYYITRQGRRDTFNIINQIELENQDEILKYNKIYLTGVTGGVHSWLKTLLDEKFIMTQDNQSNLRMRTYVKKDELPN